MRIFQVDAFTTELFSGNPAGVCLVEDVLTTGGSTRETMQVATVAGGQVVGAASIVNRRAAPVEFDVPFAALLDVALPTYDPGACPLCAQGVPVVKPGSRQVTAS